MLIYPYKWFKLIYEYIGVAESIICAPIFKCLTLNTQKYMKHTFIFCN